MNNFFTQIQSIDFIDIGCSGSLDEKWAELFPLLSYIGFDPNEEECHRLNSQPHSYKSALYFPYAIADKKETKIIHKTKNIYCYSLLRPNHAWFNRFSFSDWFQEVGTSSVACTTLNDLAYERGLKADIIKIDTQGLELPIFRAGEKVLLDAFCIETETGFVEGYLEETTYAQIDEFMRAKGYLMFDLKIHRVSRKNSLAQYGKQQPLWCEATWLFDFIGQNSSPTREQAIKSLMICKALNYFDYGLELATFFSELGLIGLDTLNYLNKPEAWIKRGKNPNSKAGKLLNLLPDSINRRLLNGLGEIIDIQNVLEKFNA